MPNKIMIIKVRKINKGNVNDELQWLGNSLGLFNMRDKNSSCFRIFITLIKKAKRSEPISSDEIAEKLHLSRGTIVHHLNRLMDSGIVVREREGYFLRENDLESVVRSLRRDIDTIFTELKEIAKDIDSGLS